MPGQNARTADILLYKINDAELKLWETLHKRLSWYFGTDFFMPCKRRLDSLQVKFALESKLFLGCACNKTNFAVNCLYQALF